MKIHTVMSTRVLTVKPESTVRELWKLLFTKHINAIPVVNSKRAITGIITKEDLLKALYPNFEEYFADISSVADLEEMEGKIRELGSLRAQDIMCKHVVYTRSDTPVMRALSRMIVRRLNQLPVLSEQNEVIGMVTKGDIFYALVKREMKKDGAATKPSDKRKSKP